MKVWHEVATSAGPCHGLGSTYHLEACRLFMQPEGMSGVTHSFLLPPALPQVRHRTTGEVLVLKLNKSRKNSKQMLSEIQLMNRLSHHNILR